MRPLTALFLILSLARSVLAADAEYPSMGPNIFDPSARGEALIDGALVRATSENKNVLLLFGANWCPWCRRLHVALTKAPAVQARLRDSFVLVFIDANTRNDKHRNAAVIEKYGNPLQYGLPVFVVLDRNGRQLTTRESASLAADTNAEVAERVLAFLNEWKK